MPDGETPVDDMGPLLESGGNAEDAWWTPRKEPPTENSVSMSKYDTAALTEVSEEAPDFQHELTEHEKKWTTVQRLAEDLFAAMYRIAPEVREEDRIALPFRPNRDMVMQGMATDEYKTLHDITAGDEAASLMATVTILDNLMKELPGEVTEGANAVMKAEQRMDELSKQRQDVQRAMKGAKGATAEGLKKAAEELDQRATQARDEIKQAGEHMKKTMEQNGPAVRSAVRSSMKEASQTQEQSESVLGGWGEGEGAGNNVPVGEKLRMAQKLRGNTKLRSVATALGRFRKLAMSKQRSKLSALPNVVTTVTTGNDVQRMLPHELMALDDDDLEITFFRKYAERQLLIYKLEDEEKVAMGPIVMLIDTSGSMSGEPEVWAKAVGLAVLDIARHQDRPCVIGFFSGPSDPIMYWRFPAPSKVQGDVAYSSRWGSVGRAHMEKTYKVLREAASDCAEYFLGGGTSFMRPLDFARTVMDEGDTYEKADIIFLTDGECDVEKGWATYFHDWRVEHNVKLVSIAVVPGVAQVLKDISNVVFTLQGLQDGTSGYQGTNVAGEVFDLV